MTLYRNSLPQMGDELFLTDEGIETMLIFIEGIELPDFAAFDLFRRRSGEATLSRYSGIREHRRAIRAGMVLESATWRASADWGRKLGYTARGARRQPAAIRLLEEIRRRGAPRAADGDQRLRRPARRRLQPNASCRDEAQGYHREQIAIFSDAAADMVTAITMNYVEEAIGVARPRRTPACRSAISFTVETDGRLPTGQPLQDAIEQVDDETGGYPAYYMLNCAHPPHSENVLGAGSSLKRDRTRAGERLAQEPRGAQRVGDARHRRSRGAGARITPRSSALRCRSSTWSAAAAVPTTATGNASPRRVRRSSW